MVPGLDDVGVGAVAVQRPAHVPVGEGAASRRSAARRNVRLPFRAVAARSEPRTRPERSLFFPQEDSSRTQ